MISSVLDIKRRKQAEEFLLKAKQAAEQATRAKSQFLASMSHEIPTPINGVLGMLDLALDSELTAERHEELEMTCDSANSLLGILNDILDLSKIEVGKLELEAREFCLREMVDSKNRQRDPFNLLLRESGLMDGRCGHLCRPRLPASRSIAVRL